MTNLPISNVVLATGFILVLIGLWGMLTHSNILRIVIAFCLIDTGIHIVIVSIGYVTGGTAPIIDSALSRSEAPFRAVDPDTIGAGRHRHRHRLFGHRGDAGLRDPAL